MNRIDVFLQILSFIYIAAFSSLLIQSKGLYGDDGILPVRNIIADNPHGLVNYIFFGQSPCLENINVLIILGIIVSSMSFVFSNLKSKIVYILLWIFYFSVYQIGQTFLWFQWDILLLETGFIATIMAPNWFYGELNDEHETKSSTFGFWLIKWLLFRLMFASGVVKLLSDCPTWWGLTALDWHYESQCIPTLFAWFAHQLPQWFQKLSVVATFVIEIVIPIFFFLPFKTLQMFCFYSQILLQVVIILSGNYNFFNLLTICLCISLLPRPTKSMDKTKNRQLFNDIKTVVQELLSVIIISAILYQSAITFGVKLNIRQSKIDSKIMFSPRKFREFLQKAVPISIFVGIVSLGFEFLRLLFCAISIKQESERIKRFLGVLMMAFIVCTMFLVSLVPYTNIDSRTHNRLPSNIKNLYQSINQYEIVNSYGLFRRMTGVGGRPEIVIEGSDNIFGPWKEYEFLYKPGNLSRPPPFLIPHQPRLDWQMWFAALGAYNENPWLLNLLYRILTNESSVIQLLDHNPFPKSPPTFVRIQQYIYLYTNFEERKSSGNWWKRKHISEYLPPISLENDGFMKYINNYRINYKEKNTKYSILEWMSKELVDKLDQRMAHYFVWSALGINLIIRATFLKSIGLN